MNGNKLKTEPQFGLFPSGFLVGLAGIAGQRARGYGKVKEG
jgi:hypothetical protein